MKDKGDFEVERDEDSMDSDEDFNFEDEDVEDKEESSDEEMPRPSPTRSKAVTFKLHKGAAGITKERGIDSGVERVTRSNTRKTQSGGILKSGGSFEIASPKAKKVLKELSGSLANPEATAALEQVE